MTMLRRREQPCLLSPLQGYEAAERQKRQLGLAFRAMIVRLYGLIAADLFTFERALRYQPGHRRAAWCAARRLSPGLALADDDTICEAYRDLVMRLGVRRVDPASPRFPADLEEFYRNYVRNFPLPAEQETLEVFRDLLSAPAREDGHREFCYSVVCPLTGHYLMGANFIIQPGSSSVFLVYGFINPIARGIGRFAKRLIDLAEEKSSTAIAAHGAPHPYGSDASRPLILFEKNAIEDMSLTDILRDSAGIDIDSPPTARTCLTASAIGQRTRDLVWHRCGARIVDYKYMQPSLDGVVEVPERSSTLIAAYLNGKCGSRFSRIRAADMLRERLGGKVPGCTTLSLCVFAPSQVTTVPAERIRLAVENYQQTSVLKDPAHFRDDIYFRAQMASLAESAIGGELPLRPIVPDGCGAGDFKDAEEETKRLLGGLTWEDIRAARQRPYREWRAAASWDHHRRS